MPNRDQRRVWLALLLCMLLAQAVVIIATFLLAGRGAPQSVHLIGTGLASAAGVFLAAWWLSTHPGHPHQD